MIQVNRIYLIFNRLVTKKFLVDTSGEVYKTNKASVSLSDTEASSENGDYLLSHCYAVPSA